MELYNFFTEVTSDKEKIEEMKYCLEELNSLDPKPNFVSLVTRKGKVESEDQYCIVGQILGEDSNIGDTDLLCIFSNLKYTLVNANFPEDVMHFNKGKLVEKE